MCGEKSILKKNFCLHFSGCLLPRSNANPISMKVKSHMDGTTSLKWPFFAINFAIVHDPHFFNLNAISFAELTSLQVVLVGIMRETCDHVREVIGLLGKQFLTVVLPINYGTFHITFYLNLFFFILLVLILPLSYHARRV